MPPYGCATKIAGAPSLGKMSTDILRSARIEHKAIEMTATRIVMGRRMAVRTSHIKDTFDACREKLRDLKRQRSLKILIVANFSARGSPDPHKASSHPVRPRWPAAPARRSAAPARHRFPFE